MSRCESFANCDIFIHDFSLSFNRHNGCMRENRPKTRFGVTRFVGLLSTMASNTRGKENRIRMGTSSRPVSSEGAAVSQSHSGGAVQRSTHPSTSVSVTSQMPRPVPRGRLNSEPQMVRKTSNPLQQGVPTATSNRVLAKSLSSGTASKMPYPVPAPR